MAIGRHKTSKNPGDPTYSSQWSGVSGAPHAKGVKCPKCGKHLHLEGDAHYCPYCDDYVSPVQANARPLDKTDWAPYVNDYRMLGNKLVNRYSIGATPTLAFEVYEPLNSEFPWKTHSTFTSFDGPTMGKLTTRKPPRDLTSRRGYPKVWAEAVRKWYDNLYKESYKLIIKAYPVAKNGNRHMGQITINYRNLALKTKGKPTYDRMHQLKPTQANAHDAVVNGVRDMFLSTKTGELNSAQFTSWRATWARKHGKATVDAAVKELREGDYLRYKQGLWQWNYNPSTQRFRWATGTNSRTRQPMSITIGDVRLTVKKNPDDPDEWIVAYYKNNKLDEGKTYHTDDKGDAVAVMNYTAKTLKPGERIIGECLPKGEAKTLMNWWNAVG